MWQDYAITVIQFAFAAALLPMVFGKSKPDVLTAIFNSALLFCLSLIFVSMHLYVSAGSAALVGGMWMVLFVQKVTRRFPA